MEIKRDLLAIGLLGIILIGLSFISATGFSSDTDNTNEWWMLGKYLNHTNWDGITYSTVSGLNNSNFSMGGYNRYSIVANGSLYVGSVDNRIYQLNASNVSQQIGNFTTGGAIYTSPVVVNGFVYIGSNDGYEYQLNVSNISQQIARYPTGGLIYSSTAVANGYVYFGNSIATIYQLNASNVSQAIATLYANTAFRSSPAIANGYVYIGNDGGYLHQLNASNVSQRIANFSTGGSVYTAPAIANGYVYIGSYDNNVYQLNASNVSQHIANFTTGGGAHSSPAVANGYIYIGSLDNKVYQLKDSNIGLSNDYSSPIINLISPIDSTSSTTNDYNFTFNVTDSSTVSNCSLIFDDYAINLITPINNTGGINGMYNSSLSVATHTWSINCTDIYGNKGNSSIRTLIVNSETPATSNSESGGGCLTNWNCSTWNSCVNGIQTRICTKEVKYCYADIKKKPSENQSCSVENYNPKDKEAANSENSIDSIDEANKIERTLYNQKLLYGNSLKIIFLALLIIVIIAAFIFYNRKVHSKKKR